MRRLSGTIATLALLAGCGGGAGADSTEKDDGPEDLGTDAWVMCEKFVEQSVNVPEVEFGGRDDTTIEGEGEGPYTVESRFSVNNAQWSPYRCVIERTDANEGTWTLVEDLQIR